MDCPTVHEIITTRSVNDPRAYATSIAIAIAIKVEMMSMGTRTVSDGPRRLSSLYAGMTIEMDGRKRSLIIANFPQRSFLLSLEDDLLQQRLTRIREIEALGHRAYGRRYEFTHTVPEILAEFTAKTAEELVPEVRVRVAGRLMTLRHMGKAAFAHLQQNGERLQIYVKKDAVGEVALAQLERA